MLELLAATLSPPPTGDDDTWFRLCDKFNELADDALYEDGIGDVWLSEGIPVTPAIADIWLNGWPAICGKLGTPGGKPKPRPRLERCEAA